MRRVGIRQLKQNASAVIRDVEMGEPVEVTDRGRPVARIVPIATAGQLDQLIAEGRATRPAGDLLLRRPLKRKPGQPLSSQVLARLRSDER